MSSNSKYSTLLVDDDAASNFLTSIAVIESDSFNQPIVFLDPTMALDYFKVNQPPLPELLLADINMPGLDGFEFVEELKKRYSDLLDKTLFCFLSSSNTVKDKMRAKALGVYYYYEKPLKANIWKKQ